MEQLEPLLPFISVKKCQQNAESPVTHLSVCISLSIIYPLQMSVGAEYTMKQSKLHMSIDSSLFVKSTLSTTISPGTDLQLCAEMQHANQHYKIGLGVMMG